MSRLSIQPITLSEAREYIRLNHRHHKPPEGWLFGCAVNNEERVVGVIAVGRPVSRIIQGREPYTAEVTRCCTDGTKNAASMLYAAAWRAARALGYNRLITYTLKSEGGASLRASNWTVVYETKAASWAEKSIARPRVDKSTPEERTLWELI